MHDINVSVWGLGPHAIKNVLPALRAYPGINLYGVYSRNEAVVAQVCAGSGCTTWTSPAAMLRDAAVNVVYVSTPIGLHAEHGTAVLSAGKHLWCEKAFAETLDQATALVDLSREQGVTVAECFMYLYHPHFAQLKDFLTAGRLGHVHTISCRFGIPPLERPGFRKNAKLGGGAFLDVGCYPISAVTSLYPDDDPRVSFAEILVPPGSPVDTTGRALLSYAGGTTATLEWRTDCAYRNEIDVWGTEGSVTTERIFSKRPDYVPRFRVLDVHGNAREEASVAGNQFLAMFAAFRGLVDDPVAAETERRLIVQRAAVADRIRQQSRQQSRD